MMTTRTIRLACWTVALGLAAMGCGGAQGAGEGEDPEVVVLHGDLGNAFVMAGAVSYTHLTLPTKRIV